MLVSRSFGAFTSAKPCSSAQVETANPPVVLKVMQPFSGYTAVVLYSTSIFDDPTNPSSVLYATLMVGVANVTAVAIFSVLVDRKRCLRGLGLGRRILLLVGTCAIGIINISVGVCLLANLLIVRAIYVTHRWPGSLSSCSF